MKTTMKRLFSLFLVLVMLGSMLPAVYAESEAAEPVELTDEDYAIVNDVFARIDAMEEAPAKKSANRTQITDAAAEIVMASENYVEGSLERNGNSFTWWTDEGIRCIYNPYMREKYANMRAPENAEEGGIYNEPKATKGGWPSGNQVYLVAPYYGIDDTFTDQYKNEAKSIATAIGDTDSYTLYSGTSVTVDKVADAIESGAVVIFDSHGTTDYDGSYICDDPDGYEVYDYVSKAKYSYLCLTSKSGLTTEDYNDGATYFTDSDGYMCACVNGAAIANHMDSNSPAGILWMAICLGMATDTMCAPMREKGVEVVYGYSQSVTFAGDYCFEETFWDNMIAGKNVATSIAAMKSRWGNWDWSEAIASSYGYSGSGYTLSEARKYRSAFPIVVSDEDTHPGQRDSGTNYGACSEQTVKSTYTLFSQYEVAAQSNNTSYGTVSVNGNVVTATPASGYFAQGYTVTNGTATVEQNGNTFTVMAESDCTVQINFAAKTAVTVNFSGANVSGQTGFAGDSMELPTDVEAPDGYKFLGWMTAPLSADTTEKPTYYTDSFIPTGNTTLYALYSYVDETSGGGSGDYVKVTETPDDWSGEYLIVYETGSRVFDGSRSTLEAVSNYQDVTITDNTISAEEADAYKFIIAAMDGGYSVQSASGLYISGTSGSNKLNAGSSAAANTINIDASGNADIVSNTSHLRYNATSGQDRFRYYKSTSYSGQKDIALYVKDGSAGTTYYTTSLCDHENTSDVAAVAATCTEVGYTAGVQCDDCGSFVSGHEVIDALGHNWGDWTQTTAPSCETAGQKTRTCSACGETETQSVAATGHSVGEGVVTTPATCTEAGVMSYSCTACGNTTTEAIPATGHSYELEGTIYTCSSCGDSYEMATSTTLQYVFSDYTAGTQYAEGEDHTLDDVVTLTINGAHLNSQIRLYAGSNAVFTSAKEIDSIIVKAGYKAGTLNVYSSTDGSTWNLVAAQATTTSYTEYSFDIPDGSYYVKLESVGAQIRVSEMSITVLESGSTEPEVTEPEITEPEVTEPEATEPETTQPVAGAEATIDFSTTDQRVSLDNNSQVWANGGATLTNNKGDSSSNVADYSNPARFYKNSEIIIAFPGMNKIEVNCNTAGYAAVLAESISDSNATVTQSGSTVTIEFTNAVDEFSVVLSGGQVRVNNLTVYTEATCEHEYTSVVTAPTCTAAGYTTYTCGTCGDSYTADEVAALGHGYVLEGNTYTCTVCGDSYDIFYVSFSVPGGVAAVEKIEYVSGGIELPSAGAPEGYTFVGWAEEAVDNSTVKPTIYAAGSIYEAAETITLQAVYSYVVTNENSGDYVKVTEAPADWSGEYLIVYEVGDGTGYVYNGSLDSQDTLSKANNYVTLNISNNTISAASGDAYRFIVAASGDAYTMQSISGFYVGRTATTNGLNASTSTVYTNTLALDSYGHALITCEAGTYLKFNATTAGSYMFRYYATGQQNIELYVKNGSNGTTYYTTVIEEEKLVESWNISLGDNIGVNFVLNAAETDEVSFTVAGNAVEAVQNGNTYTINLAAAQMTDEIVIYVNGEAEEDTYSVRKYADIILSGDYDDADKNLVMYMLAYGGAAQTYFAYNTENMASDGITVTNTAIPEAAENAQKVAGKVSGVQFYGASLVYRNKIAVRFYFTGDVSGLTFTANNKEYKVIAKDDMHYVEIADILPQDLDTQITVTVSDGTDTLTVTYGPMNYIVRMNAKGSDTMKALVLAMYNYHLAAKAYAN